MNDDYTKTISVGDIAFLRQKFKTNKIKKYFAIATIVLTIILASFGITKIIKTKKDAVTFNPVNDQTSRLVYLDVKQLSGWILEGELNKTYYAAAVDENNYYYLVFLNDNDYSTLNAQYEYFEEISDVVPSTKRVYGKTFLIDPDVIDGFIEEGAINNKEDFNYYYGIYGLNITAPNAIKEGESLCIYAAVAFIISIILWISILFEYLNFTKSLDDLNDDEIYNAANELLESGYEKGIVFTDNYLFDFNKKVIMKFDKVIWNYDGTKTTVIPLVFFIRISTKPVLVLNTKTIKNYKCDINFKEYIESKTRGCLKGYNNDNRKLYNDIRKGVAAFERNETVDDNDYYSQETVEDENIIDNSLNNNAQNINHAIANNNDKKKISIKSMILGMIFGFIILFIILLIIAGGSDDSNKADNSVNVVYGSEKFKVGEVVGNEYKFELNNLKVTDEETYAVVDNLLSKQVYLKDFNVDEYYLEVKEGEENIVVLYAAYDTDEEYSVYFDYDDYGTFVEADWLDWDETGDYIGITIKATNKGYAIFTITNDYNEDDEIKVFVYCK